MTNEELAVLIQQGHKEYVPELYEQIRKLLTKIAYRYFNRFNDICSRCGITQEDLNQEGYFVMLEAVQGFKPEQGNKFVSYLNFPYWNHFQKLTGCKTSKRDPINNSDSLDKPLSSDDENFTLMDTVEDKNSGTPFDEVERGLYLSSLHDAIEKGLETLDSIQKDTIQCRYYEGKTLDQTGEIIGCSREQVRQHQQKALRTLRKPKTARTLIPFLYDEMDARAYRGTGLSAFRNRGGSAPELTIEQIEEMRRKYSVSAVYIDHLKKMEVQNGKNIESGMQ
ncbi:RNA polymerase sigma factor RpoS [Caprobacter fermentans]|uniref:RNA polymerase sigma factor RpoS n=1 Tax=Caproicibacter fermentans TaxID=2576756 RepID=A0A6N8HZP2_9FIRM|nr:sigma-70 family RNA polymerase sigma factor [Caproicibacter fermentans]MVB11344.1 RNA polymerase sigma factor RpoS [Caproicibacter fermentans]